MVLNAAFETTLRIIVGDAGIGYTIRYKYYSQGVLHAAHTVDVAAFHQPDDGGGRAGGDAEHTADGRT